MQDIGFIARLHRVDKKACSELIVLVFLLILRVLCPLIVC